MGKKAYALWSILNGLSLWKADLSDHTLSLTLEGLDTTDFTRVYRSMTSALGTDLNNKFSIMVLPKSRNITVLIDGKKAKNLYNEIISYDEKYHRHQPQKIYVGTGHNMYLQ